ncbi:hypothetical protein PHISCL_09246 [Aspergillus sclerotialis]|uniref:Uncharacterized protein n=1 Tax=Aspergillus sclerotialis TaxID=2070753 RepID=A0A3A2ZMR2_9EURO|nr:hypothetical protein PHISCL_09246 [Aspergillus sclerotialis]
MYPPHEVITISDDEHSDNHEVAPVAKASLQDSRSSTIAGINLNYFAGVSMGKMHGAFAATGKRSRSLEYEPVAPKKQRCYQSEPPMHTGELSLSPAAPSPQRDHETVYIKQESRGPSPPFDCPSDVSEANYSIPDYDPDAESLPYTREESLISPRSPLDSIHTASVTGEEDKQSVNSIESLVSASPSVASTHTASEQEQTPFTTQFFKDMASTIAKCFPADAFAIQHHCEYEDVCKAINGVVVGPLTIDGFMDFEMESHEKMPVEEYGKKMIDRWNEIPKKSTKRYPVSRNPRAPAEPVKRVKVFKDEYGNYVPLDEVSEEQRLIEEDIRVRQERRQRCRREDFDALLHDAFED